MKTFAPLFRSRSTTSSLARLRTSLHLGAASLAIGGALAVACNAHATNYFYDSDGDNTNGLSHANGIWSSGVALWSPVNGTAATNSDVGWTNNIADSAMFSVAPTADFTLTMGESLTMNGFAVSSAVNKNLLVTAGSNNYTVTLGGAGIGVNQAAGFSTVVDASIIGTAGLLKYNTGTLILARNNTYSGTTIVKGNTGTGAGGVLQIGNGGTTGTLGTGGVSFQLNGTVAAGTLQTKASTVSFNRSDAYTASNSMTIEPTANTVGGIIQQAGSNKLTLTGAESTGTAATNTAVLTFNIGRTSTIPVDTEVSGVISGTGTIAKIGAGVLLLSGANTFATSPTLTAGTILVGADSITAGSTITSGPLGTGTLVPGAGAIGNGSSTVTHTIANPITLTNALTFNVASLGTTDAPLIFSGAVNTLGATIASTSNADVTFSGLISNTHSITINNATSAGRIIFSNNNTYHTTNTSTTINGGTLVVANVTGGTATNSATGSYPVAVNSTATLSGGNGVGNGGSFGTITSTGTGYKTPTSSTYASGMLGTVAGQVIVASGGTIAPGNAGVGTLTVGALTLNTGAGLTYEFNGTANDLVAQVAGTGSMTGNGATGVNALDILGATKLTLLQAGTANPFSTPGDYNLFTYSSLTETSAVTLANLSIANPVSGFGYTFTDAGGVIQLDIAAVPEPSTWVGSILSLGMVGFALRRRMLRKAA